MHIFLQPWKSDWIINLLVGDLNYDQLSPQSMELVTMCQHYHLDQLITEPTRIITQSQSLLDVVLTTKSELICDSGILLHSMSDHSAIYCFRKSSLKNQPRYHTYRDMDKFRHEYAWYTLFMEIADLHAPLKTKRCRRDECHG